MRGAAARRHASRQLIAAISLLMLGVLSLSAAGWLAAASPSTPVDPPLDTVPASSVSASAQRLAPTDVEPSTPRSASSLETGHERRSWSTGTAHHPEPVDEPPVAAPATVEVPSLGIRSELIDLGLDEDRRLEVPADPELAGWWVGGARPGERGPAIIVGHVDSFEGPAVFWRLHELEPGDLIAVHDEQGATLDFEVDRVGRWPKDDFPSDEVYRQADGSELRLITCGGAFDRQTHSYLDNIIVFATKVPRQEAPSVSG